MTDNARELRRFRAWAKKQRPGRLDLDRDNMNRSEFMWCDTQLAWEAWQARAAAAERYDNRVRIDYGS